MHGLWLKSGSDRAAPLTSGGLVPAVKPCLLKKHALAALCWKNMHLCICVGDFHSLGERDLLLGQRLGTETLHRAPAAQTGHLHNAEPPGPGGGVKTTCEAGGEAA